MRQLLNTLYVTTQYSYLRLDHETLRLEVEGETQARVPLHHLGGIVCFGNIMLSPPLIERCAEDGRMIVLLNRSGKFKARIVGPLSGNILLRKAQFECAGKPEACKIISQAIVAGKIQNSRKILVRAARESDSEEDQFALNQAADRLAYSLEQLKKVRSIEVIRGVEGEAAKSYFEVMSRMIRQQRESFEMNGRSRRPPRDRFNAILSFLYTLLLSDCNAAAEGVGLDYQMGFLHVPRPGRPSLGLDLMEELRAYVADRLAVTLVNRKQLTPGDFSEREGGAVLLNDDGRKKVIIAYQKRKKKEIIHPFLDRTMAIGLIPHVQARLLARTLRGEMESYIPFLTR